MLQGTLNIPIKFWNGDIGFEKEKIVLEYDGGGHDLCVKIGKISQKDFEINEIKRAYAFYAEGWKIIRFISSNDKLPQDKVIVKIFNFCKLYLLNSNHHWIKVYFDTEEIECSAFKTTIEDVIKEEL